MARRNAAAHRLDFRVINSLDILSGINPTTVVTSHPGRLLSGTEIIPHVALHLPKTVHLTRTVEGYLGTRILGNLNVEFEDVSIDGWKHSANVVLYLKSWTRDVGGSLELIMSEVTLVPQKSLPKIVAYFRGRIPDPIAVTCCVFCPVSLMAES